MVERRLDLAGSLTDPTELGDIYAMASWCAYHIGRYRDAERYADRGVDATIATAPNWALYCLDWRAVARCRLGEWEAFFGDVSRIGDLLGDRRDSRPGRPRTTSARPHSCTRSEVIRPTRIGSWR